MLGAEHLLMDLERARARLEAEWQAQPAERNAPWMESFNDSTLREQNGQPADRSEMLVEPVSWDGYYVRLNIRPCKALGITSLQLWPIFLHAAQSQRAHHKDFIALWQHIILTLSLPFSPEQVLRFDEEMRRKGYPAVHHSKSYHQANKPSYRLGLGEEVTMLLEVLANRGEGFRPL